MLSYRDFQQEQEVTYTYYSIVLHTYLKGMFAGFVDTTFKLVPSSSAQQVRQKRRRAAVACFFQKLHIRSFN